MNRHFALTICTFFIGLSFFISPTAQADEVSDYLSACVQKTRNFQVCQSHINSMLFGKCFDAAYTRLSQEAAISFCNSPIPITPNYIKCVSSLSGLAGANLPVAKSYCVSYAEYAEATQCTEKLYVNFSAQDTLSSCTNIMAEKVRLQSPKIDLSVINENIRLPMDSVLLIENEIDLPFRGCGSINVDSKSKQCQVCRKVESRNDITLVHDSVTPRTMVIQSLEMQNQGRDLIINIANDPDQISHIRCRNTSKQLPVLDRKDVGPYLAENGIKLMVPPPIRK